MNTFYYTVLGFQCVFVMTARNNWAMRYTVRHEILLEVITGKSLLTSDSTWWPELSNSYRLKRMLCGVDSRVKRNISG